ncbi:hypothetical protein HMH01_11825 [Halovulum dunhuangense]|uniref:Leishmanolysin n=1 Tax=Halovulum dunhuangense TaxID=1505036 RepID=A0A849L4J9_9RHOB|nr:hypothetical protein [Halovulum dunhuangense]NNU81124.1 hypothetical protein [Halovulum dunhuangense]
MTILTISEFLDDNEGDADIFEFRLESGLRLFGGAASGADRTRAEMAPGAPWAEPDPGTPVIEAAKGGEKGRPGGSDGGDGGGGADGGGGSVLTGYVSGDKDRGRTDTYNIQIDFFGTGWTVDLQQEFIDAAEFLSDLVLQGLGNILTYYPGTGSFVQIDDLRISASLEEMDGVGGVLGYGGPYVPTARDLPYQGLMAFDTADALWLDDAGLWDEVVLHEMLHVLGVGTLWDSFGLVAESDGPTGWAYTGAQALAVYVDWLGSDAGQQADGWASLADVDGVPIEVVMLDDGTLAPGGHWDEGTFGDELMTPYLNDAGILTELTTASLADMGYAVDQGLAIA